MSSTLSDSAHPTSALGIDFIRDFMFTPDSLSPIEASCWRDSSDVERDQQLIPDLDKTWDAQNYVLRELKLGRSPN